MQQCTSGLGITNQTCYELSGGCFTTYGFDYKPGIDDGFITWVNNNETAWTVFSQAMVPDPVAEIGRRLISREPMVRFFGLGALRIQRRDLLIFLSQYIIMNLAISEGFSVVDYENLQFPAMLSIDYVRVYQPKNAINIGCDPVDFPTAKYIETWVVLVDRLLCSSDSRFL